MIRDLRHAARFLWAHKSFAAAAVLTLAIGLGANTALLGLMRAAFRPIAVPHNEQIVAIANETRDDTTGGFQYSFSTEALKDLQERATAFSAVVGVMPRFGGLSADGRSSQFFFSAVSENFFTGLGVSPVVGSVFTSSVGAPAQVVLGHTFWMTKFGGDPNVVGRRVRIDGSPAVVIGVVPQAFRGTLMAVEMDGYVTLEDYSGLVPDVKRWLFHNRKARPVQVFGRLKPGVSMADAQVGLDGLMTTLEAQYPESDKGLSARVIPEPLARPLPMRAVTDVLPLVQFFSFVVAGLVLLLACMNVANLLLVRATAREREMAVRAALGASRGRLVRQMVTEGLVLAGLGGIAGYGLGQWVTSAFVARIDVGADLPLQLDTTFDVRTFLWSLVAAAFTGVLIGLWPAWRAAQADARAALHDGAKSNSDGTERQRVRRVLVVGQIAGSLSLLIVAGLFVRSLVNAQQIDLGFDAAHLLTVRLDPRQIDYDQARTNQFYKDLQRRVGALPGVESVAVAFTTPMSYLIGGGSVFIEGQALPSNGQPPAAFMNRVGHNYFETMRIPVLRGRDFVESDEDGTPATRKIVIINEAMAAKYWPGQDPIGKHLRLFSDTDPLVEVVGVVRDSKYVVIFEQPRPYIYLPLERDMSLRTLHVRTFGAPAALAGQLEHEIKDLAPGLPLADLRTMEQSLSGIFGFLIFRIGAIQAGGMGLLGLVLAVIGVYGVVSFGASLRTREIGIRVALGAEPRDVLRLILGQGLQLVGVGIIVGLAASFTMSRALAKFLPLVNASDWVTFVSVAAALSAMALLACYLPARRATRVPVMTALRHE